MKIKNRYLRIRIECDEILRRLEESIESALEMSIIEIAHTRSIKVRRNLLTPEEESFYDNKTGALVDGRKRLEPLINELRAIYELSQ